MKSRNQYTSYLRYFKIFRLSPSPGSQDYQFWASVMAISPVLVEGCGAAVRPEADFTKVWWTHSLIPANMEEKWVFSTIW